MIVEVTVIVANRMGLHLRAASALVEITSCFKCEVILSIDGREVNAKSIMGVIALAATQGTELLLRAEGEDSTQAIAAVDDLFKRKFDEE